MDPQNPYLKRLNRNKIGKAGRASEKRLAKKLGGKQTPGSGNMEGAKGDIRAGEFLIEAKSTMHATYPISWGTLCKIQAEATRVGKSPALTVSFVTGDGRPLKYGDWAMIPLRDFEEFKAYKAQLERDS